MPPRKSAPVDDSSSSEDSVGVDYGRAVEAKAKIDKIRQDRTKARAKHEKELDKKLSDLRARIQQTTDAHMQQLAKIDQKQLERLDQALEAREAIEQQIRDKVDELHREACGLAMVLGKGYAHRRGKAQARVQVQLTIPKDAAAAEREEDDGRAARPRKKMRVDTSSA